MAIHPEVFLAAGYAIFLVFVSLGLDSLARHSHARSERYRTAGFTYHHTNDAWICPENQLLLRSEVDHGRRLIRYRGRPQICNHCPAKPDCTDSDEGREVVHAMDPWPPLRGGPLPPGHLARCGPDRGPDPRGRVPPQPLTVRAGRARRRVPGRHADSLAPARSLPCQPGQLPDLCAAGSRGTRPPGILQGPYVGVGSWVSRA
jgi:hypothetical protein